MVFVSYEVSTSVFEGPFDLLLHLILKEQVDIYEVNLSHIVDAYLHEIERLQHLDLDLATEFLLIASTLVEMSSAGLSVRQAWVKFRKVLPVLASSSTSTSERAFSSRPCSVASVGRCKNCLGAWLCASSNSMMGVSPTW